MVDVVDLVETRVRERDAVVAWLDEYGPGTIDDVATALGWDRAVARRVLRNAVAAGVVARTAVAARGQVGYRAIGPVGGVSVVEPPAPPTSTPADPAAVVEPVLDTVDPAPAVVETPPADDDALDGRVADAIRAHPDGLATSALARMLDVPRSAVFEANRRLRDRGVIETIGSGRGTRWRPVTDDGRTRVVPRADDGAGA